MNEKTRAVLDGRARDIIFKVHKYFETEKDHCTLLLQQLTTLTLQDENEVKVPLTLFADVLNHLKSSFQVTKRVVAATGINKNTLTKIKAEGIVSRSKNTDLATPKRKPRGKKKFFSTEECEQLKKIVVANFMNKKHDFKFRGLLSLVRRDLDYTGSLATLRRIMWDMGFRWEKKPGSAFVTLSDKSCIGRVQTRHSSEEIQVNQDCIALCEEKECETGPNLCFKRQNIKSKFDDHQDMINQSLKTGWECSNKIVVRESNVNHKTKNLNGRKISKVIAEGENSEINYGQVTNT